MALRFYPYRGTSSRCISSAQSPYQSAQPVWRARSPWSRDQSPTNLLPLPLQQNSCPNLRHDPSNLHPPSNFLTTSPGPTLALPVGMPRKHHQQDQTLAQLRNLYGDTFNPFSSRKHARYHDPNIPYHIIARLFQGLCLLTPSPRINDIINGIIGRAQELWPDVKLYAHAVLSNHLHWMIQGHPHDIPAFIGFIKREISRRCAPIIGWKGDTMWSREYWSTALPTEEAQINCLRYIASQSVKEGLVERPEQWPGVHCAHQLWGKGPVMGTWLDGTRYGKACYKQSVRPRNKRRLVERDQYITRYEVRLTTIPAWQGLSKRRLERELSVMHEDIVKEGAQRRGGRRALGARAVMRGSRRRSFPMPQPPWFGEQRRMICWSSLSAPQTRQYLQEYWAFQLAYREASAAYLAGDDSVAFPPGAFKPPVFGDRSTARRPKAA